MTANSSDVSTAGRPLPMAGGFPISEVVARQAAEWLTLLMSTEATDEDRRLWQQWRKAHPDHERAWQHIEVVTGRLKVMHSKAAYKALSPYAGADALGSPNRRAVLRALMWAGGAGTIGLLGSRTQTWQQVAADYRTGIGEQRRVSLEDGTVITLNTASAIDVRFDGQRRLVRLAAGEILVVTGHAASAGTDDARPLLIETADGRIRALGTRFIVRQRDDRTQVAVLESAVEITPRKIASHQRVLRAGEQTSFTREAVELPQAAGDHASAWAGGQIVADDMRLGDFIAELGRYRFGILRCAPEVAELRFSGVFPLQETDRILSTLPNVLPVQVTLRTRYWATIEPAR